ncbi:unnamed protein product, partial [Brassica oleracea var. botrytis]
GHRFGNLGSTWSSFKGFNGGVFYHLSNGQKSKGCHGRIGVLLFLS